MTNKIYKTAMGKTIDMGSLILQNENVRAVGNMNVNARGDVIDSNDRVIDNKSAQVKRQTNKQVAPPTKTRVMHTSSKVAKEQQAAPVKTVKETVLPDLKIDTPLDNPTTTPKTGLAAALAKSKSE